MVAKAFRNPSGVSCKSSGTDAEGGKARRNAFRKEALARESGRVGWCGSVCRFVGSAGRAEAAAVVLPCLVIFLSF